MQRLLPIISALALMLLPLCAQAEEQEFTPPPGVTKVSKPIAVVGAMRDYAGSCGGVCQGTNGGERCVSGERPFYSSAEGTCECWADKTCARR